MEHTPRFTFLYGDTSFWEKEISQTTTNNGSETVTTYQADALRVIHTETRYEAFGAYGWENRFETIGDTQTEIISELWDAVVTFPVEEDPAPGRKAYIPDHASEVILHAPTGSNLSVTEFYQNSEHLEKDFPSPYHLQKGRTYEYTASGGRSSDERAPFFHLRQGNRGVMFAIGWTGQWRCRIKRTETEVVWQTKIEDTHFRLLPGENIRTSSVLVMPYEGSVTDGINRWRRLIKENFSPLGKGELPKYAPFSAQIWGGMPSDIMKKRIETLRNLQIPAEYFWIDAGWYGMYTEPCIDEFEGDWGKCTGDWRVNPHIHPEGLRDVSEAAEKAGMQFLLWAEPERVVPTTPTAMAHPEYFLPSVSGGHSLLNLGNPDAWQDCFDTLSGLIETLHVSCYRQDFNMFPLAYWRRHDAEDRRGITEIKHIMGLYRLWDALSERFPHLLIDNCASGGKRIDIETLKRSVPLWRSDRMCQANYPETVTQTHNMTFGMWMPYSGTSTGREFDPYRIRSAYAAGMTLNYTYTEYTPFGEDESENEALRRFCEEYLRVRPYFSEDIYPLTEPSEATDIWSAVQFDRPSQNDGIVQVFRREDSPYEKAAYFLGNIEQHALYHFTDADTDKTRTFTGKELAKNGFPVEIPTRRTAMLFFYKKETALY